VEGARSFEFVDVFHDEVGEIEFEAGAFECEATSCLNPSSFPSLPSVKFFGSSRGRLAEVAAGEGGFAALVKLAEHLLADLDAEFGEDAFAGGGEVFFSVFDPAEDGGSGISPKSQKNF
jgi:hypothetical protein